MVEKETDAEKIVRLEQWVADCQAGMYINCVYCGHRYGPDDEVPAAMADVLKEHIEQCPEHPLSRAKAKHLGMVERPRDFQGILENDGSACMTACELAEYDTRPAREVILACAKGLGVILDEYEED